MKFLNSQNRKTQEAIWGYLLVAPSLILLTVFFYYALGNSLYISLTNWNILSAPVFIGFKNYIDLFQDDVFLKALWNTTRYTLVAVSVGQLVSLGLALALNSKIRFQNIYRLVFFLPVLTMPVAIGVVWKWIYNPQFGPLASIYNSLGLPPVSFLTNVNTAWLAIVVVDIWLNSGYNMVIILAGLQNIPRQYYEAAQLDGANSWNITLRITLPLLTPTLFFTIITALISSFQVFDLVYIMTKGGPLNSTRTMAFQIYYEGFHFFHMGIGTATAWILLVIIIIITMVQFGVQKRWVNYE